MDRRQYLGLTGASIVALLGGCSSSGSQSTATATDTPTATATPTETATDTPTEEPTETATATPEPQNLSFQEIYDDVMAEVDAGSVDEGVLSSVDKDDWSAGDLEQVAVSAAQSVGKENAMAVGKALYENFSSNPDELYVDSRHQYLGGDVVVLEIFDKRNDSKHYLMPWGDVSDEGVFLREGENPDTSTERNLEGLEDSSDNANRNGYDTELHPEKSPDGEWVGWIKAYSDLLIGEKYGKENLTVTESAAKQIRNLEIIDPSTAHIEFINEDYEATNLDQGEWRVYDFDQENGWTARTVADYTPDQGYAEV